MGTGPGCQPGRGWRHRPSHLGDNPGARGDLLDCHCSRRSGAPGRRRRRCQHSRPLPMLAQDTCAAGRRGQSGRRRRISHDQHQDRTHHGWRMELQETAQSLRGQSKSPPTR
eukprot:1439118-Heterocapsa_arctica.AAC.1